MRSTHLKKAIAHAVLWSALGSSLPAARAEPWLFSDPPVEGRGTSARSEPRWVQGAAITLDQLSHLRAQLGSSDAGTRTNAAQQLGHLTADSLPTIEARLRQRRQQRPEPEAARTTMTAFRRAVGSRRADDDVDIEPGALSVLAERRDATTVLLAESLLLLRSLERMQTRAAGLLMAEFVELDEALWAREVVRARSRAGLWILPALIELRSDDRLAVKRWAQHGVHALDMSDPKRATGVEDPHLAAQVITAYTSPLDFSAMPPLVRLVAAEQDQVREAARLAVTRFGKNAVWQLRELFEELTGQRASRKWDWQRTAQELYTVIDRERIETASTTFAQGMQAYVGGDLDAMAARFDAALATYPELPERDKMAPGYVALGDARMAEGDLAGAERAYHRAMRLAPSSDAGKRYAAKLWFARSERALAQGVVDLAGYDKALTLDPQLEAAQRARSLLDGTAQREERTRRRWAAAAALVLMLTLLALLLTGSRRAPAEDPPADVPSRA